LAGCGGFAGALVGNTLGNSPYKLNQYFSPRSLIFMLSHNHTKKKKKL
jgi:hypothetical protein